MPMEFNWKRMYELKQADWLEACKEHGSLTAAMTDAVHTMEKMVCAPPLERQRLADEFFDRHFRATENVSSAM
jgi:hypothetical protein